MFACRVEETPCAAVSPVQHSMEFAAVLQHAVGTRNEQVRRLLCMIDSFSFVCYDC
jgi:hypothetical protein